MRFPLEFWRGATCPSETAETAPHRVRASAYAIPRRTRRVYAGHMMKELLKRLPPGLAWRLRDGLHTAEDLARAASVWKYEARSLPAPVGVGGRVAWLGRRDSTHAAELAFAASGPVFPGFIGAVRVTELPAPGALRVPTMVRLFIDLDGTLDEVLARASHDVWRRAKPLAERARVTPVTSDAEIDRVDAELLKPYAARHGEQTHQVPLERVRTLAHEGGLVSISVDGEEVAARLGYEYARDGQRCYAAWRFGYPARVFSDPERYGAMNSLNTLLSIRHAHEGGYAVLDFGLSPAHPVENGQLQFKRLRGAAVSTVECHSFFSVKVPPDRAPDFFWARPLFSVEHGALVLNVGLPATVPDRDLLERFRKKLVFKGVSRLRLHAARPLDAAAARALGAVELV